MNLVDIRTIKQLNAQAGHHWFEPATLRFFRSRYAQTAEAQNGKAYFVSSERFDDITPRLYSVRACDLSTGYIETIGEFQAYTTSKQAYTAIKKLLKGK